MMRATLGPKKPEIKKMLKNRKEQKKELAKAKKQEKEKDNNKNKEDPPRTDPKNDDMTTVGVDGKAVRSKSEQEKAMKNNLQRQNEEKTAGSASRGTIVGRAEKR